MVKNKPKIIKSGIFYAFQSVAIATCNLNVIVVLEFISRDMYLLFCNTFLNKIPKFNFLRTREAEIRP